MTSGYVVTLVTTQENVPKTQKLVPRKMLTSKEIKQERG